MKLRILAILVLLAGSLTAKGQELETKTDTLQKVNIADAEVTVTEPKKTRLKKPRKFYDPKVASRRSAIVPGLGQIYNDSWWKVPLLYGGFGLTIYYIDFNNQERILNENLVNQLLDDQANNIPIDTNALRVYRRRADTWRRNRDTLYLVMVGIYVLNIAEAAIDAHLKGFDVGENLSMNLKPKIGVINNGVPYMGMGITLPIGGKR